MDRRSPRRRSPRARKRGSVENKCRLCVWGGTTPDASRKQGMPRANKGCLAHTRDASRKGLTQRSRPRGGFFTRVVRRCPTLPQGLPCSTIGAGRLSFRVRNGTGRFPLAMAAETLLMFTVRHDHACRVVLDRTSRTTKWTRDTGMVCYQVIGLLVPVSCTHYCASTSGLSTQ